MSAAQTTLVYWMLFFMVCTTPIVIFGAGYVLIGTASGEPNKYVGFRTKLSVTSKEAWQYANETCGRIWKKLGIVLAVVSAACMLLSRLSDDVFTWLWVTMILVAVQIACMLITIAVVQHRLRQRFGEGKPNGTPTNAQIPKN